MRGGEKRKQKKNRQSATRRHQVAKNIEKETGKQETGEETNRNNMLTVGTQQCDCRETTHWHDNMSAGTGIFTLDRHTNIITDDDRKLGFGASAIIICNRHTESRHRSVGYVDTRLSQFSDKHHSWKYSHPTRLTSFREWTQTGRFCDTGHVEFHIWRSIWWSEKMMRIEDTDNFLLCIFWIIPLTSLFTMLEFTWEKLRLHLQHRGSGSVFVETKQEVMLSVLLTISWTAEHAGEEGDRWTELRCCVVTCHFTNKHFLLPPSGGAAWNHFYRSVILTQAADHSDASSLHYLHQFGSCGHVANAVSTRQVGRVGGGVESSH